MDHNSPHATQTIFFGRYILEDDLVDPVPCLSEMLALKASKRVADKAIVSAHAHQMTEE